MWVGIEVPEDLNEKSLLERACKLIHCFLKSPALQSLEILDDSDD